MATKTPDLWNRLPSVAKLLEQPQLRRVADRWNRSAVANGVRSFLIEVKDDLRRRAADIQLPSLHELAERAARHVVRNQESPLCPTINATGRLLDPAFFGRPIAYEVLERIVALGSCYSGSRQATAEARACGDAATRLCRLTGAEAATVVSSYAGAIWLALASTSVGRETLISCSEAGDAEPGCSIASLAASAGTSLIDVGAVNNATAADYESTITECTSVICKHVPDSYRITGDTKAAEIEELVGLARDRELTSIHALGAAPLVDNLPTLQNVGTSIAASVAAGAHITIARGDGFVGGPRCGIILGSRELVQRIEQHPLFAAWQADPLVTIALEAVLELYDDRQRLQQSLPLYQLLATPIENLLDRAQRLAPQLAQADDVAAAEVVATQSGFGIERYANCAFPSHGIALSAAGCDVASLDQRLRTASMPVIGRHDQGRLVLDLRTVFPREDQRLVETILAIRPTVAETEQAPAPEPSQV